MLRSMGTVLRPVGPEPAQTYWVRRLAIVGVAVAMLAVIVALIVNGTSSGSAVQALPPPPTQVAADSPSPIPSPSPSGSPSASASPSADATGAASTSPQSSTAAPSTTAAVAPSTTSATASASASASPPPVAACAPRSLRPTLTGNQRLRVRQHNTFRLSLINGSGQTCVVTVTRDNFELKIYSGTDRIWSTKDCATIVKPATRKLDPEQALEWSMRWNGRRSKTGCKSGSHIPRPGTYWATAQLAKAEPVQLRMLLVG
jgi:hypothetical protein